MVSKWKIAGLYCLMLIFGIMVSACRPADVTQTESKFTALPPGWISLKEADRIVNILFTSMAEDRSLWYNQVDTLRKQNYVISYTREGSGSIMQEFHRKDTIGFTNVTQPGDYKLYISSLVDKIKNPSGGAGLVYDDICNTIYMETGDVNVYNSWIDEVRSFVRMGFKVQISAFDERHILVTSHPIFLYYFVKFEIKYKETGDRRVRQNPVLYTVQIVRSKKPR